MNRGLKRFQHGSRSEQNPFRCEDRPDEQGIETLRRPAHLATRPFLVARTAPMNRGLKQSGTNALAGIRHLGCEDRPDEQGIETRVSVPSGRSGLTGCEDRPDEQGIETWIGTPRAVSMSRPVARTAPMNRGLKRS